MPRQPKSTSAAGAGNAPPLPFDESHWQAIVAELELSSQQAKVLELMLRGLSDKEIAAAAGISESTMRTYQSRIASKTRSRGRMELAMRILETSRRLDGRRRK